MIEIVIGFVSGIVASLGMGGGAVLIPLLGLFTKIEQHLIQGTNLIFFIPTSITAIIMNVKSKNIDYHQAFMIVISGMIGALVGSYCSFVIDNQNLKKYFGIFLICIAIFEIFTFIRQYIMSKKEK